MTITPDCFGMFGAGTGGIPKKGLVPSFAKAAKLGIKWEKRDLSDIPFKEEDLDYQIKVYQSAQDAGIRGHLLGLKADPVWVLQNPKDYEDSIKLILSKHRNLRGAVAFMVGREPTNFKPADYAAMLQTTYRLISSNLIVFGCVSGLEYPKTYRWIDEVLKALGGICAFDVFAFNWHGNGMQHVWDMAGAVKKLRQMIDEPLWLAEGFTWGAANTAHDPQTDAEQAMGDLSLMTLAFALGVDKVFLPAMQDTSECGPDFYGYGMLDAQGKPKIVAKWVKDYIANMTGE